MVGKGRGYGQDCGGVGYSVGGHEGVVACEAGPECLGDAVVCEGGCRPDVERLWEDATGVGSEGEAHGSATSGGDRGAGVEECVEEWRRAEECSGRYDQEE